MARKEAGRPLSLIICLCMWDGGDYGQDTDSESGESPLKDIEGRVDGMNKYLAESGVEVMLTDSYIMQDIMESPWMAEV